MTPVARISIRTTIKRSEIVTLIYIASAVCSISLRIEIRVTGTTLLRCQP